MKRLLLAAVAAFGIGFSVANAQSLSQDALSADMHQNWIAVVNG